MRVYFIFQLFFILVYHHASCVKANNPRKNLIVEFNPYVSILDRYDQNRYNISEMLPLVAKVATEFDCVLIDLKGALDRDVGMNKLIKFPPDFSSSLLLSPLAVATYNAHRSSSQPLLEVWLAISEIPVSSNAIDTSRHLKYISEKANDIYEGTVTTILLKRHHFRNTFNKSVVKTIRNEKVFQASVFKRVYKWGAVVFATRCNNYFRDLEERDVRELEVDIVLLDFTVDRLHPKLTTDCNSYIGNNSLTFWFRTQGRNHKEEIISMTRYLDQWTRIQKLAEQNDMPVVVSSAFDISCENVKDCHEVFDYPSYGWWRLKENPDYRSTAEYNFETKEDIVDRFDDENSSINLKLVAKNEQKLPKRLGITFSFQTTFYDTEILIESLADEEVFEAVITRFSEIVINLLDDSSEKAIADKLNFVARYFLEAMNIVIYVPNDHRLNVTTINQIQSILVQAAPIKKPMFITNFKPSDNNDNVTLITESSLNTKMGIVFPLSYCLQFETLPNDLKTQVVKVLAVSDTAFFSFEERKVTVELGVDRMFQQRLVTFAQCSKFLNNVKGLNSTIGDVKIGFLMERYVLPSEYYEDAQALYNFVLYWDKLGEWASKKKTSVVMSGMLDSVTGRYTELGWWRRQSRIQMKRRNSTNQWIDKWTDLIRHSDVVKLLIKYEERAHNGRNSELTTNQIVTISVTGCLVIFLLMSIPICFLARYYKRKFLSSSEMNDFFRGNQNPNDITQQFKLPYDKSKFEIEPKSFSIDHSRVLGSGEFGIVNPGKVKKSDGEFVDVAVKMVNTNKYHKSALTGLLSEIKVLAHVGKHENIIELHGAFTADLKRGKIFVFLELGQCGSLEKYLRNLCPQRNAINESSLDEEGMELAEMQTFVNSDDAHLESVSDELYRWSREICSGMSFLASKHVVHADLATRNVLLNAEKTAKICDFGLSRRMYNYANYVKQSQEPLPWKWMSPESLRLMEFNEKTDVWSYGVTLWEIYSLGDIPFQGISFDPNFSGMLERGFRMGKPKYNDRNMYSMMTKCWTTNPLGRPTFEDLRLLFDSGETID